MVFDFTRYLPAIIGGIVSVLVLLGLLAISFSLLKWRHLLKRKTVALELTPPADAMRSLLATQKLLDIIHGLNSSRPLKDKLLKREVVLAFEILSSRAHGIRFALRIEQRLAASMHQSIAAYVPHMKMAELRDELPGEANMQIIEFKQAGHYAFPLALQDALEQHDPVAYITGTMTKLNQDELMDFQLTLTPTHLRKATILAYKILGNEDLLTHLNGRKILFWSSLSQVINSTLLGMTDAVGEIYHGPTKQSYNAHQKEARDKSQIARRLRPARTLSSFELELMETMHHKLNQPLFRVSMRAAVKMNTPTESRQRLAAIKTSLQAYSVPPYQSLKTRVNSPLTKKLRAFAFTHRLPSLFARHAMVLSSSELASLYHFPLGSNSQTDNLITSLSRTLSAPVSL
ncbi:MAG: hypothetical protein ACREGF_02980, partial [Candidatus Saccharimonadales bacterium]